MPVTRLVLIRHGETDFNREQRFQGQVDVPLNEVGREQARRLAQRLAGEPVNLLVSSDLTRARETAAPLAEAWGVTVQTSAGLREQSFGVLEGYEVATVIREQASLWEQWVAHRADFALPGGESARQFHARVIDSVRELASANTDRTVAVVTHGGVLDMLWRTAHRQPLDGLRRCDIPNTGINRLRWREGLLFIDLWADASHLAGSTDAVASARST